MAVPGETDERMAALVPLTSVSIASCSNFWPEPGMVRRRPVGPALTSPIACHVLVEGSTWPVRESAF